MKKILTMGGIVLIVMGILNILAGLGVIGDFDTNQKAAGVLGGSMAIGTAMFIFWLIVKFKDRFID